MRREWRGDDVREEGMPVFKNLSLLVVEGAVVWDGVFWLETGLAETARAVLSSKDVVGFAFAVGIGLVGDVKDIAWERMRGGRLRNEGDRPLMAT